MLLAGLQDMSQISLSGRLSEQLVLYGYGLFVADERERVVIFPDTTSKLLQAGGTLTLSVSEAIWEDLSAEQKYAVGKDYAIQVRLLRDNVEIHTLDGYAEITVMMDVAVSEVNRVDDEGKRTPCEYVYDQEHQRVTFTTDQLSVFAITVEDDTETPLMWWGLTFVIILVDLSIVLLLFGVRRREQ